MIGCGKSVIVSKPGKYRAPALLLLIVACVSVAAFRNVVSLGIISYVHLFYVPAIVAGLWYGRKSLEIVMPLGIIEILLNFLNAGQLTPAAFLDGFMLIVVAAIVGLLSENKDQLNEKLTESVSKSVPPERGARPAGDRTAGKRGPVPGARGDDAVDHPDPAARPAGLRQPGGRADPRLRATTISTP